MSKQDSTAPVAGDKATKPSQPRGKGADKRPTKFSTKPAVGSGSIIYVLEKAKE